MHGSTQKPQQTEFDFNRAAKLKIIERAQLLMLNVRSQLRAKSLLKVIESHSRENPKCWLSIETIRIEMGGSESTVHRAIADCEAAGLLSVIRAKHACSTFALNWSLLIDLSRESIPTETWDLIRAGFDSIKNRKGGVSLEPIRGVTCDPQMTPLSAPGIPPNKPTTTLAETQNRNHAFDFEWGAVVVALENEGILAGGQSVLAASANGASPEFVLQLIAHAQRVAINGVRAYGPGALMRRIGRARPSQSVDALWPPPCAGYLREVEREKRNRPAQTQPSRREAVISEASSEVRAELDRKFQSVIANMRRQSLGSEKRVEVIR